MHWAKIRRGVFFFGILIFLLAFPYGPLFPWSPWKPGFEHLSLQRADVYWPRGSALPDAYRQLDALIAQTEGFEQLDCTKRITVVQCGTWQQFRRLMPHMSTHALGAVTLATGEQIYVTPKIDEKKFDHREFLLHELGHAVINQHQSILAAFQFSNIQWLSEGISVANSRQSCYMNLGEVLSRAAHEPLGPVIDPDGRAPLDMRFAYPVWRYFNEYLMTRHGRDTYQVFLTNTAANPSKWSDLFEQAFGHTFKDEVDAFQETLHSPER